MDEQPSSPSEERRLGAVQPMPAPPSPSSYPPGSPTPATAGRTPSHPTSVARLRAGMALIIGGGLVVIGVFLPWVTATGPAGSFSQNGLDIGTYGTLILGGFAVARGLSWLQPTTFKFNLGTPLIGGILLAVLMVARWGRLQDEVRYVQSVSSSIHASIGIGVWSVIAGTALILVGGVLASRRG